MRGYYRSGLRVLKGVALVLAAATLFADRSAHADRLVFERGGDLFVAGADGQDARRVLSAVGDNSLWAISPDGHRLVWALRSNAPAAAPHSSASLTLYLGDLAGRRRKRLLSIDHLLDRQGSPVTTLADGSPLAGWVPLSLAFSADGRTLYLGGVGAGGRRATVAVDAVLGAPLVDAEGRWKVIAPFTDVDARGTLLVGVSGLVAREGNASLGALSLFNLAAGAASPLPGGKTASVPALSPDGRRLAYTNSAASLQTATIGNQTSAPAVPVAGVASGARVLRVRWSPDGSRLVALIAPASGVKNLVEFSIVSTGKTRVPPKTLLSDPTLGRFEVAPD